ncbi:MAG: hypothetical protein E7523_08405 [Ruminococcaceae bacterium]|nr:hypothetical protein [Oscillospiraceae bacterium]
MTAEAQKAVLLAAYDIIQKVYRDVLQTTPRGSRHEDLIYDFQEVMDKVFKISTRLTERR